MADLRVTIWNEFVHERENEEVGRIYPDGMHAAIAAGISRLDAGLEITTATLDVPDHGLPQVRLDATDVLIWWGHRAHARVEDEVVDRVHRQVLEGMGLIVLHSGHFSKIFKRLMGTACSLRWREAGERERLWVCNPGHPIAQGVGDFLELEQTEMYGEPFAVPEPEEQVFVSWFEGGEVFRSGCCWHRGNGRIFYFRPGHETYPIYHNTMVHRVIANAVRWCAPRGHWEGMERCANVPVDQAREPIQQRGLKLKPGGHGE